MERLVPWRAADLVARVTVPLQRTIAVQPIVVAIKPAPCKPTPLCCIFNRSASRFWNVPFDNEGVQHPPKEKRKEEKMKNGKSR